MFSEIQNKVIDQIDRHANVRAIEDFDAQRDANSPEETVVEITTYDGDEYYFRYNVWPDGETEIHRFKLEESKLMQYDEMFGIFRDKKEETNGDVSFDVVVKNEIEKEKKTMAKCNFERIAAEIDNDCFKEWVEDNAEDLVEYAEDAFREAYTSYIENGDSYEELAHNAIDEMIEWLDMSEYTSDDIDAQTVIEEVLL